MISTRWIAPHPPKRAKYGNTKTTVDGIKFDSRKEANRFCELKLLQKAGAISALELQPEFPIVMNGKRVAKYCGDFRYEQYGSVVVEDVKSPVTRRDPVYRLKKKLVEAQYGIQVTET
jgi:hypothetical protein